MEANGVGGQGVWGQGYQGDLGGGRWSWEDQFARE